MQFSCGKRHMVVTMEHDILLSGFADEIDSDFEAQLQTVTRLHMKSICLRSAGGTNISDFTVEMAEKQLMPPLRRYGVSVSCIGSPIGKVGIEDDAGWEKQLQALQRLCDIAALLDCTKIRVFSFYIPEGKDPAGYYPKVLSRMQDMVRIAREKNIVLLHENEKEIYGDNTERCVQLMEALVSPHFLFAFDPANFVQCGVDPLAAWEALKDCSRELHVKDALFATGENVLCGSGDGKLPEIIKDAVHLGLCKTFTLEPHLVLFDSLQSLETKDANEIIGQGKARTGAEAYELQLNALKHLMEVK